MNLDSIGVSTVKDSTAFKKIQFFSKTNPTNLFNVKSDFQNSFTKLNSLYLTDLDLNQSYTYGMDRQHAYTSLASSLPMSTTLMDSTSVNKFFEYNLGIDFSKKQDSLNLNRFDYDNSLRNDSSTEVLVNNFNSSLKDSLAVDFSLFLKMPNTNAVLGAENDSKQYANNFKFLLNFKHKKKSISNFNQLLTDSPLNDSIVKSTDVTNNFANNLFNTENTLKFKDFKSNNAQFLGSERTVRLLNNLNSNSFK